MFKITINDNKYLYFFLPIYKSFFCKLIDFKIDSNDKDVKKIEKALNIKKRKERITYIYDEACNIADDVFSNVKNPCGFKNNKCYVQRCRHLDKINGCCRSCRYQSVNGCLTRNLTCKLFFCSEVKKRYKVIDFSDIKILKVLSLRQRYLLKSEYFSKREDIINDLFYGSLFLGAFRILYRLIKSIIIMRGDFSGKNNSSNVN